MKHLYLLRHGESTQNTGENRDARLPDHAIPLTQKGKQQALEAGAFLKSYFHKNGIGVKNIKIWNSPYLRTRETASIANIHLGVTNIKEDAMLTELQFGIFNNMPKDEIKDRFPLEWETFQMSRQYNGKYFARRPGGESPLDCEIRQKLFIDTLFRDFSFAGHPDNIIIVGHGGALNIFRKAMFHHTHEWYEAEPNPGNCSIQHLTLDEGKNTDHGYIHGEPMEEKV